MAGEENDLLNVRCILFLIVVMGSGRHSCVTSQLKPYLSTPTPAQRERMRKRSALLIVLRRDGARMYVQFPVPGSPAS
jgi:hypothetical protein